MIMHQLFVYDRYGEYVYMNGYLLWNYCIWSLWIIWMVWLCDLMIRCKYIVIRVWIIWIIWMVCLYDFRIWCKYNVIRVWIIWIIWMVCLYDLKIWCKYIVIGIWITWIIWMACLYDLYDLMNGYLIWNDIMIMHQLFRLQRHIFVYLYAQYGVGYM